MDWIITILALGIVIFIHELGHLLAAKRAGIGVPEFSIGMGPKIFSWQGNETTYKLRLLPLGGFVKLSGLDEEEGPVPDALNYHKKTFSQRFLTIVAGAAMNILLGFVLFSILYATQGKPVLSPVIGSIVADSPAQLAGLQVGDKLLSIDTHPIKDVKKDFILYVRTHNQHPITLSIARADDIIETKITPTGQPPQIGVGLSTELQKLNIFSGIAAGFKETVSQIAMTGITIKMLITGSAGLKDLAGPVGILQMASTGLHHSVAAFLGIMAMISIGLGTANLLPLPVLDGGHIVFLIIEKIRGKKLPQKVEATILNAGVVLLIGLMLLIIGNDVLHWKERTNLLNGSSQNSKPQLEIQPKGQQK